MTRIIAGSARGRRLKVPAINTRPTSDRVREAIFSSLQAYLDLRGLRVLDLFAGSGALGLEAISRGAGEAVLVDNAASAVAAMRQNVQSVSLAGIEVVKARASDFLARAGTPFDVVFLDPPYAVPASEVQALLEVLADRWLAEEAVVVVERGARDIEWPQGFCEPWYRPFGDTHVMRAVWYGHRDR